MMAEPLVELVDAGKRYPRGAVAVEHVNLTLANGEFVSLLGPSGCGKSTVLRMIAGLSRPSSGVVRRRGVDQTADARLRLGCVFQDPTLLPWATVWNNVYLPLRIARVSRRDSAARVHEALALVGLTEFAHAYPRQLSGGMRMRGSLARALATQPRLMLLDEPLAALDEISRQVLNDELRALWRAQRWTALFITHSVFEAVYLSTRVLVMSARPGRIVEDVAIDLPVERTQEVRSTPRYIELCRRVSAALERAMRPRLDCTNLDPAVEMAAKGREA
jgi:NitT/TauT family transport system ATP-binding protein